MSVSEEAHSGISSALPSDGKKVNQDPNGKEDEATGTSSSQTQTTCPGGETIAMSQKGGRISNRRIRIWQFIDNEHQSDITVKAELALFTSFLRAWGISDQSE
jgi:hypothetical protein